MVTTSRGPARKGDAMARSVHLTVERLEKRTVPALPAHPPAGGLTVTGDGARDHVDVFVYQGQLVVRDRGQVVGSFNPAAVASINIQTDGGNDVVHVGGTVTQPVTIDGGAGNDKLGGGPANDNLSGG